MIPKSMWFWSLLFVIISYILWMYTSVQTPWIPIMISNNTNPKIEPFPTFKYAEINLWMQKSMLVVNRPTPRHFSQTHRKLCWLCNGFWWKFHVKKDKTLHASGKVFTLKHFGNILIWCCSWGQWTFQNHSTYMPQQFSWIPFKD